MDWQHITILYSYTHAASKKQCLPLSSTFSSYILKTVVKLIKLVISPGKGGPIKKGRGARRKESFRCTKVLFCGHGMKQKNPDTNGDLLYRSIFAILILSFQRFECNFMHRTDTFLVNDVMTVMTTKKSPLPWEEQNTMTPGKGSNPDRSIWSPVRC